MKRKYTKEQLLEDMQKYISETGKSPTISTMKKCGFPSYQTFVKLVGQTPRELLEASNKIRRHTEESAIASYENFLEDHGRPPTINEMRYNSNLPTREEFIELTGKTPSQYYRENCKGIFMRMYDDYVKKHGELPNKEDFSKPENKLPDEAAFKKYVGTTPRQYGVEKFDGLAYNQSRRYSKQICFDLYNKFVAEHGRYPTMNDLTPEHNLPSFVTFLKHTGMTPFEYKTKILRAASGAQNSIYTKEVCLTKYNDFVYKHGRCPTVAEMKSSNDLPSYAVFQKYTGMTPSEYGRKEFKFNPQCSDIMTNRSVKPLSFISQYRTATSMSIQELSSATAIPTNILFSFERNTRVPTLAEALIIAKALQRPVEDLFSLVDVNPECKSEE